MLNLMRLEFSKSKIGITRVLITNMVILLIFISAVLVDKSTNVISFKNYEDLLSMIGLVVRAVFFIFATVLISRTIINEYKNKTINVMFMYPIKRGEIMLSKILNVIIFSFTAMVLSGLIQGFCMYLLNSVVHYINEPLLLNMVLDNILSLLIYSILFSIITLIPMYVGVALKSSSATLVTAIILTSVMNSGSNGVSLSSIIIIPITLAVIALILAFLYIKDLETKDVINF